ncbi:MAG: hypothetical protein R3339_03430 [Thermodesulfobacteriota bacterium]|nr:hypothetical protein [Thermodesulfobacteriota bacterium]
MKLNKIVVLFLISALLIPCSAFPQQDQKLQEKEVEKETEDKFSLKEKQWAVRWITDRLSLLMEDGLIKRIKCYEDDENYEVYVSSAWGFLSIEEKKRFLADFSRAREITQHTPYLSVRDDETGEVLAKVNKWGIFIFEGSGEYFTPLGEQEEDWMLETTP